MVGIGNMCPILCFHLRSFEQQERRKTLAVFFQNSRFLKIDHCSVLISTQAIHTLEKIQGFLHTGSVTVASYF